jgi:hypothetical protein
MSLHSAITMRRALCASLLALSFQAMPASATTYCYIRPTTDGFVALRSGPDAGSRMVARMRPGEEVLLEGGRQGVWRQAHLMRRSGSEDGYFGPSPGGWVHSGLIHRCY